MPLDAGLHPGVIGMFAVFQFSDDIDRDVVHIETHSGDRYLEEQSSVLEYLRLFDAVTHRALDNSGSRELLTRLVDAACRIRGEEMISTHGYARAASPSADGCVEVRLLADGTVGLRDSKDISKPPHVFTAASGTPSSPAYAPASSTFRCGRPLPDVA